MSQPPDPLRPWPLYFLGDSSVLVHSEHLYHDERAGETYVGRALYLNGVSLPTLATADGTLAPAALTMLEAHGLLVDTQGTLEAFHRSDYEHWRRVAVANVRERREPILVVSVGHLDIPQIVGEFQMRDLAVSPEILARANAPREFYDALPGAVEMSAFAELCAERVRAFAAALRALRTLGFDRVYVPSIVPPIEDDDYFRRSFLTKSFRIQRYKIAIALNALVADACRATGVRYVDMWRDETLDGLPIADLYCDDDLHLAPSRARKRVEALFR